MKELLEKLLPKYILSYFGTEGLTSSEANHIANMAKEIAENHTSVIKNMKASQDKITIEGKSYIVQTSEKPRDIDYQMPGMLFGLSAWLRQAVKAKDEGLTLLSYMDLKLISTDIPSFSIPQPQKRDFKFPDMPADIDISRPLGDILDIKEYAEYLELESEAAHLGKIVHAGMPLDNVRNDILNWKAFSFMHHNDKDYVVERTQCYTKEEINKLYFELQAKHRDIENKLNWYKAKIKNDAVVASAVKAKEYSELYNFAQGQYSIALREWNVLSSEYDTKYSIWSKNAMQLRAELSKLFSTYKIIVPERQIGTLDYIKTVTHSLKATS